MTVGRQILVVLAISFVSSAIVYGICLVVPKTYETDQSLIFPVGGTSSTNLAAQFFNGASGQGGDTSSFGFPGSISSPLIASSPNTAMGILESRSCRAYVSEKLDLPRKWKMSQSKAIAELEKKGKVRIDDNGLLVITGQADNPELARDIAKTMFDYLNSGAVELTLSFAKRNRKALEDRFQAAKTKVEKARVGLVTAMITHPNVDVTGMQGLLSDGLKKYEDAKVTLKAAEARISNYEKMVEQAIAKHEDVEALQAINGGTVDRALEVLAQDLKKHQTELEVAKSTFTEKSPEFKAASLAVEADRTIVKKTVGQAKSSLKSNSFVPLIQAKAELEAFRSSAKLYESIFEEYKRMALKTPGDLTIVRTKQSEFDAAVRSSESLNFQLEQAIINEERDPARFEVMDEAVIEPDPVAPRKGFITGGWFAATLALGTWWIARRRIKFVD